MKRPRTIETLNDDVLIIIASFLKEPKSWQMFMHVSTQFLHCGKAGINFHNALLYATGVEHYVKFLLSCSRVDPSADNNYAIRLASYNGHDKVVALLLADSSGRVDPSAKDNYAMIWASRNGHDKVVALLLFDPRVDASAENNEAIQAASVWGYDKVVTLLLNDPRVSLSANDNQAIKKGI